MTSSDKALQQIRKMRHFEREILQPPCLLLCGFEVKFWDIMLNNGLTCWKPVLCPPINERLYGKYRMLGIE